VERSSGAPASPVERELRPDRLAAPRIPRELSTGGWSDASPDARSLPGSCFPCVAIAVAGQLMPPPSGRAQPRAAGSAPSQSGRLRKGHRCCELRYRFSSKAVANAASRRRHLSRARGGNAHAPVGWLRLDRNRHICGGLGLHPDSAGDCVGPRNCRHRATAPLAPQTAGWILLVVLLPLIGTLIYFLVRKPTEEEILQAQEARAALGERSPSVHQRLPDE
jgi:hypothetical protein